MGTRCPKAPPQPTREEVAARLRADEDAAAAERRRAWVEVANGRHADTPPPTARAARGGGDRDAPGGERDDGGDGSTWARVREEARAVEPGHSGTLLWIDARCQKAGMHPLDLWWVEKFREFYASGKMIFGARVGLRGAKSVSVCRALVNDALFTVRDLDPGTIGVIPIMSSDRTEATDRFHTIKKILRACGIGPEKAKDDDGAGDVIGGGLGSTYRSTTLPSGGGVIIVCDSQGHEIQFRIYPARITGAIGYTAVAGFLDEVDTWLVDALGVSTEDVAEAAAVSAKGRANPGDVVIDRVRERFTTTRATAHLYIVSASYKGIDSAHWRVIDDGDTPIQYVARLGAMGAARDDVARRGLALSIGSEDPRLTTPADPATPNVGAWATNPSKAAISDCYEISKQRIGPMLGRYGGRPDEATGARGPLADVEPVVDERPFSPVDVVMGVAPPKTGLAWGRVLVGIDATGRMRVLDDASGTEAFDPARYAYSLAATRGASVIAVAKPYADILTAHLGAAYMGGVAVAAPVAPVDVYDGDALRVGPLRDLYARGKVGHGEGQAALAQAIRGFREDERAPRVEALVAAVARLVACYPWLGAQEGEPEPMRGVRAIEGMTTGVDSAREMLRRLGARP
jgi:hypothetical protein